MAHPGSIEITSHESELGAWEMFRRAPDARLEGLLTSYCGYGSRVPAPAMRRHLPGHVVPLIFMFEPGFVVVPDPCAEPLRVGRAFVAGINDRYATTSSSGVEGGLQVDMTPLGARVLLGLPMHHLTGAALEADEVLGPEARHLAEQLHSPSTWEERFDAVDRFMLRRAVRATFPDEGLVWAYQRIVRSGGSQPIAALAERLQWSPRRLVAEFRDGVGLAPKSVARITRFNRAVELAQRDAHRSWADIAAETGYYDQPHLVREFVAMSGSTPRQLVSRMLPPGGGIEG
jgi:AraC-like DNA-binding protein